MVVVLVSALTTTPNQSFLFPQAVAQMSFADELALSARSRSLGTKRCCIRMDLTERLVEQVDDELKKLDGKLIQLRSTV